MANQGACSGHGEWLEQKPLPQPASVTKASPTASEVLRRIIGP
jgi:hypothetical protein